MSYSGNLALVEEFFLLVSTANNELSEPIQISASVDLRDFSFTEDELQKLRRLAQRLELSLLSAFNDHFEVASVIVEVRSPEG